MKFLTQEEATNLIRQVLGDREFASSHSGTRKSEPCFFEGDPDHRYFHHARTIIKDLGAFEWCMVRVTATGIWPSSENFPLYYRLRQACGDKSTIEQKPVLVAFNDEREDLISFVHIGMMSGWDMQLITSNDRGRAFVSHDGFYELSAAGAKKDGEQVTQ